MEDFFSKARPIFVQENTAEPVVSCGYRADFDAPSDNAGYCLNITGRSYYRLYINGRVAAHGPARTAKGYLRVDEIDITDYVIKGHNYVAIEQISFGDAYGGYSNDNTLENGVIIFELRSVKDGCVVSFSSSATPCLRLNARRQNTERKAHCREASEIWDLDESYYTWRCGDITDEFHGACEIPADFTLLPRRMKYPELRKETRAYLTQFGTFTYDNRYVPRFYETPSFGYREELREHVLKDLVMIREQAGKADVRFVPGGVSLDVCGNVFLSYDLTESFVGFAGLTVKTDSDIRVDIVTTELQSTDGTIPYEFNMCARVYVKKGEYSFLRFDPALARYIRIYITSLNGARADVTVTDVHMLTYCYPDTKNGYFMCSDDDLNRLYMAARKTLLLNTLDIFMDCPDRERGGWLCDSFWTARAAAIMLGDTSVEKAFIENFLLTDPDLYYHAFFPSVYPGSEPAYPAHEISTWSFWLLAEICEYVKRTDDGGFILRHAERIDRFIDSTLKLKGESGLIESLPVVFVDWSQSNRRENTFPISTAANALFAFALREYAALTGNDRYKDVADSIGKILSDAVLKAADGNGLIPDSFTYENGALRPNGYFSEAAHFTALWSELLGADVPARDKTSPAYRIFRNVIDKMGPASKYRPDPNIGKSGLFIGEFIRFDMLSKLRLTDTLINELKAVYYPQLREGPGTLWENEIIETSSRCHGFCSHVGYFLTRRILGIDIPDEQTKHFVIEPNPVGLRWARGTVSCKGGCLSAGFVFENGHFTLDAVLPAGYTCDVILPPCVKGLEDENISINIV